MAADGVYFDTAFLFRLYWEDPGWEVVRRFAAGRSHLICAAHGCAEIYSCAHRKRREGVATGSSRCVIDAKRLWRRSSRAPVVVSVGSWDAVRSSGGWLSRQARRRRSRSGCRSREQ